MTGCSGTGSIRLASTGAVLSERNLTSCNGTSIGYSRRQSSQQSPQFNAHGECVLKRPELAQIVANSLLHFDGEHAATLNQSAIRGRGTIAHPASPVSRSDTATSAALAAK